MRDVLARLPESVDLDAAVLLTDELVANAILHTGSDHFEVHVTLTDGGVRVGVIDADPRMPAARIPAPDDVPSLGASAAGRI